MSVPPHVKQFLNLLSVALIGESLAGCSSAVAEKSQEPVFLNGQSLIDDDMAVSSSSRANLE